MSDARGQGVRLDQGLSRTAKGKTSGCEALPWTRTEVSREGPPDPGRGSAPSVPEPVAQPLAATGAGPPSSPQSAGATKPTWTRGHRCLGPLRESRWLHGAIHRRPTARACHMGRATGTFVGITPVVSRPGRTVIAPGSVVASEVWPPPSTTLGQRAAVASVAPGGSCLRHVGGHSSDGLGTGGGIGTEG